MLSSKNGNIFSTFGMKSTWEVAETEDSRSKYEIETGLAELQMKRRRDNKALRLWQTRKVEEILNRKQTKSLYITDNVFSNMTDQPEKISLTAMCKCPLTSLWRVRIKR